MSTALGLRPSPGLEALSQGLRPQSQPKGLRACTGLAGSGGRERGYGLRPVSLGLRPQSQPKGLSWLIWPQEASARPGYSAVSTLSAAWAGLGWAGLGWAGKPSPGPRALGQAPRPEPWGLGQASDPFAQA